MLTRADLPAQTGIGSLRTRRRPARGHRGVEAGAKLAERLPLPVVLLFIALVNPSEIPLAGMKLSPSRIVLLAMFLPVVVNWLSGKAGKIRAADIFVVLFWAWAALSLFVAHGQSGMQPAGILAVETVGSFLLARTAIRSAEQFRKMAVFLFWVVAALLPFAIVETLTASKPLIFFFGRFFPTVDITYMTPRMGLWRVQGPFDHSILFGTFCGCLLALVHMIAGRNRPPAQRWLATGTVFFTAAISFSSGAITGMAVQIGLMAWDYALRHTEHRWKIMWGLVVLLYFVIDALSNQSVPAFFISHFSFDTQSAGFRLLIWDYGSASALNHPLFGVGMNDWDHPNWMPTSIDMFWLVNAVRYGLPGGILMVLGFLCAVCAVGFKRGIVGEERVCRTAYVLTMTSLFLVGWTVHYWDAMYVLFMFLLGSGMWLLDSAEEPRSPRARLRAQAPALAVRRSASASSPAGAAAGALRSSRR